MKLRSLLSLVVLFPAVAAAQGVDNRQGQLELLGQAPSACLMRAPVATGGVNATYSNTSISSGEIQIVQLANPQTAEPQAASIALALPVVCNSAHRLLVRSANGGLLRDGGSPANVQRVGGFGEFLGYEMQTSWAGQDVSARSDVARQISIDSSNAAAGNVALQFSVAAGGGPLVAGRYADNIVVEFQASN